MPRLSKSCRSQHQLPKQRRAREDRRMTRVEKLPLRLHAGGRLAERSGRRHAWVVSMDSKQPEIHNADPVVMQSRSPRVDFNCWSPRLPFHHAPVLYLCPSVPHRWLLLVSVRRSALLGAAPRCQSPDMFMLTVASVALPSLFCLSRGCGLLFEALRFQAPFCRRHPDKLPLS